MAGGGGASVDEALIPQQIYFYSAMLGIHPTLLTNLADFPMNTDFELYAGDAMMYASSYEAGNPYDGVNAHNPDPELADAQDRLDDFITAIDAIAPTTLVDGYIQQADTTFAAEIGTGSGTELTALVPETLFNTYLTQALTSYLAQLDDDAKTEAAAITETSLFNGYIVQAMTTFAAQFSTDAKSAATGITPTTLFNSFITQAVTSWASLSATSNTLLSTFDPETVYEAAAAAADTLYDTLIDEDLDSVIDDLVDAFEAKTEASADVQMRAFNAGMLDVGAVAGTQFHVELSLYAARVVQAVAEFRAQLTLELKRDRLARKSEFIANAANNILQGMIEKIKAYQANEQRQATFAAAGAAAMLQAQTLKIDTFNQTEQREVTFSNAAAQDMLRALLAKLETYSANEQRQAAFGAATSGTMLQAKLAKLEGYGALEGREIMFITQAAQMMVQTKLGQLQGQASSVAQQMDSSRMAIMAQQDEIQLDVRYETEERTWDLNLLQYGVQCVSAVNGATTYTKSHDGKSMLGNFVASGAAGAATGLAASATGVGAPMAAALGIMSGLGGMFG